MGVGGQQQGRLGENKGAGEPEQQLLSALFSCEKEKGLHMKEMSGVPRKGQNWEAAWRGGGEGKGGNSFTTPLPIPSFIHQAFIEHLLRCQDLGTQR